MNTGDTTATCSRKIQGGGYWHVLMELEIKKSPVILRSLGDIVGKKQERVETDIFLDFALYKLKDEPTVEKKIFGKPHFTSF